MKYQSLEQIAVEAEVHPGIGMSRRERLERWAELLEQQPNRRLSTIDGTEFGSRREREAKRSDHSPLTVASEDPVLRAEGLGGDRVGDAVEFFDLAHREVHRLVCYCHHGLTVLSGSVAARVRMTARQNETSDSIASRVGYWKLIRRGCAWAHVLGVLSQVCGLGHFAGAVADPGVTVPLSCLRHNSVPRLVHRT
jgi:hypothetical protein